jgi:hypothetical protein
MRTTPPHLQPVLSRIKRFVEKMPEGTTLTSFRRYMPTTSYRRKTKNFW